MKRTFIAAVLILSAPYLLLAEGDGKSSVTKTGGQVELKAGYGHTSPYEAEIKLDIAGSKMHFKPFVALKGITPYSSAHIEKEDYTFTGTAPLSENPGNAYESFKETESRGATSEFGFNFDYMPASRHTLSLAFEGENLQRSENGVFNEELRLVNGINKLAIWNLNSPLLRENIYSAKAGYRLAYSPKGAIELNYHFRNENEAEEKQMNAVELRDFDEFSRSLVKADACIAHHNLHLALKQSLGKTVVSCAARYENRSIRSNDLQWLDDALVLEDHFRHQYQTAAFLASCRYMPLASLSLFAELEYAFTAMQGTHLHDFLPKAAIEWRPFPEGLFSLRYGRSLLRPSFALLNPAEIRLPFAIFQGNGELVGMHLNSLAFDFDLKREVVDFHLNSSYIFTRDGYNGIWMERNNVRIYNWGNEGIRNAWSLTPSLLIRAAKGTAINARATVIWDKRYAKAIDMTNANWGCNAHLGLEQALPAAFAMKLSGDVSYGATMDLYRREGLAYTAGLEFSRKFGKQLLAAVEGRFHHYANDLIGRGAYTGNALNCPEHIFSLAMKVRYSF